MYTNIHVKLSLAGFRLAASIGSGIDLNKDLFVNVSIEIMHYNAVIIGVDRRSKYIIFCFCVTRLPLHKRLSIP